MLNFIAIHIGMVTLQGASISATPISEMTSFMDGPKNCGCKQFTMLMLPLENHNLGGWLVDDLWVSTGEVSPRTRNFCACSLQGLYRQV